MEEQLKHSHWQRWTYKRVGGCTILGLVFFYPALNGMITEKPMYWGAIGAGIIVWINGLSYWKKSIDARAALPLILEKSVSGDAESQAELGAMYIDGIGIKQDYKKGAEWAKKSSDQWNREGQHNYALALSNGLGVEKDYVTATALWYIACAQGLGESEAAFSNIHKDMSSEQIKESEILAFQMAKERAESGDGSAQASLSLGLLYSKLKKDYENAYKWFHESAKKSNPAGQFHYGDLLISGAAGSKDTVLGLAWLIIATKNQSFDFVFRDDSSGLRKSIQKLGNKEELQKAEAVANELVQQTPSLLGQKPPDHLI